MDQDDLVLIPLRAFQRRIAGNQNVDNIYVTVQEGVPTKKVQAAIELLMRERRRLGLKEEADFHVMDMQQIVATVSGTTQTLTALLGAVAAVSLLVGGIGIMNIMLVSVTERTREIGIRLAIGAMENEVLLQFLVEAVNFRCWRHRGDTGRAWRRGRRGDLPRRPVRIQSMDRAHCVPVFGRSA
jgi:putative ABC transport system permease protein